MSCTDVTLREMAENEWNILNNARQREIKSAQFWNGYTSGQEGISDEEFNSIEQPRKLRKYNSGSSCLAHLNNVGKQMIDKLLGRGR